MNEPLTQKQIDGRTRRSMNRCLSRKAQTDKQISKLQSECSHNGVIKIPKANTGNYDQSADCYWYECKCPHCDKFWLEDQ